jgi:hypothetical protein
VDTRKKNVTDGCDRTAQLGATVKHYYCDRIEDISMGRVCGTHGRGKNAYGVWVIKS